MGPTVLEAGRKRRLACIDIIARPAGPVNKKLEGDTHTGCVMSLCTLISKTLFFPEV